MSSRMFFLSPRRAALEKWKQRLGPNATYTNLIGVFERAGYKYYADRVRQIVYGESYFKLICQTCNNIGYSMIRFCSH